MVRSVSTVLAFVLGIGVGGYDGSFTFQSSTADRKGCFQQNGIDTRSHTEDILEERCFEQDVVERQCHAEEILEEQRLVIGSVEICETVVVDSVLICE